MRDWLCIGQRETVCMCGHPSRFDREMKVTVAASR